MRVSVIGPVPPTRGGIAQHTANVIDALAAAGHDVCVVGWKSQYPKFLYKHTEADDTVSGYDDVRTLVWWNPITWWRARRRIRRHRSEMIWIPWVTPFHAVVVRFLLHDKAQIRSVHVHNAHPHEPMPLAGPLTRFGLGRADQFLVHSSSIANDLATLGLDQPVTTTPHPPNLSLAPSPPPPSPPFRLLFLGFVRPYKGLGLALDAMIRLPESIVLTVAGEFWEPVGVWESAIDTLGLVDRVRLIPGYQSDEAVGELLASHHVLVCPYRSATQSGLVPLAHAAGRPVVATNVGGLAEAVETGADGILCEVDPDSLAKAITQAVDSYDDLHYGAAAKGTSWAAYVSSIELAPGAPDLPA